MADPQEKSFRQDVIRRRTQEQEEKSFRRATIRKVKGWSRKELVDEIVRLRFQINYPRLIIKRG